MHVCKLVVLVVALIPVFAFAEDSGQPQQSSVPEGLIFTAPSHGYLGDSLAKIVLRSGARGIVRQARDTMLQAAEAGSLFIFSCKEPMTKLSIAKASKYIPAEINAKIKIIMLNEAECDADFRKELESNGIKIP